MPNRPPITRTRCSPRLRCTAMCRCGRISGRWSCCCCASLLAWWRSWGFEVKRWAESDHPKVTSSGTIDVPLLDHCRYCRAAAVFLGQLQRPLDPRHGRAEPRNQGCGFRPQPITNREPHSMRHSHSSLPDCFAGLLAARRGGVLVAFIIIDKITPTICGKAWWKIATRRWPPWWRRCASALPSSSRRRSTAERGRIADPDCRCRSGVSDALQANTRAACRPGDQYRQGLQPCPFKSVPTSCVLPCCCPFSLSPPCGLAYELIAGALSSYLIGDSVLQFSTVIGVYLFAMGCGSWLSRFVLNGVAARFVQIELLVRADRRLFGGSAVLGVCVPHRSVQAGVVRAGIPDRRAGGAGDTAGNAAAGETDPVPRSGIAGADF